MEKVVAVFPPWSELICKALIEAGRLIAPLFEAVEDLWKVVRDCWEFLSNCLGAVVDRCW